MIEPSITRAEAQAARAAVEEALDDTGWPWRPRLSLWLDALILIEEADR